MRDFESGHDGLFGQDPRADELDRLMVDRFGPEWTVVLDRLLEMVCSPLADQENWARATGSERCDALTELLCAQQSQAEVDPTDLGLFYVDDELMVPHEYRAAVHDAHAAGLFVVEPMGSDC